MKVAIITICLIACGAPEAPSPPAPPPRSDVVHLSEEAILRGRVHVGRAERRALGGGAAIPAEVDFEPTAVAHVAALAAGRFIAVNVSLGESVTRGQVLAVMASADVATARARLEEARARLDAAQATLVRQQQLAQEGVGARRALIDAQAEVAQLQAEMAGLRRELSVFGSGRGGELALTAPMDGIVILVNATVGETASTPEPAFVVVDPRRTWIRGSVPELQLGQVREDDPVTVRVHAFPELALEGTITYVAPALDETSRSVPIRVTLREFEPRLRRGLFGTIELRGASEEERPVTVAIDALATVDDQDVVFVPTDEPRTFRVQAVELGRRAGGFVAVRSGLSEGAAVVVAGSFTLKGALREREIAAEHEE